MIRNIPKLERPREKLLRLGVASLSNSELIANIIRSGTRSHSAIDIAHEVLKRADERLDRLSSWLPEELMESVGVGMTKACQIVSAFELGRRAAYMQEIRGDKVSSPERAADFFRGIIGHADVEHFAVAMLNVKREVIAWEIVSMGTLNSSIVHPREVFKHAIRRSAQSVLVAHNHPSGAVEPSAEDDLVTERLRSVGQLVGIPLVDHIIVSASSYYSYLEHNRVLNAS